MKKNRSSLSKAESYEEIGKFWDEHDLTDFWTKTESADFTVEAESESTYFAVDAELSEKIRSAARKRGISADTLLNLWLQEKTRK